MKYTEKDITVVIISNANTPELFNLTRDCIKSIQDTSEANILVIEQADVTYDLHTEVWERPFNYNKLCNHGVWKAKTDLIVLANNDLLFMKGWAKEMVRLANAGHPVISPVSPGDKRQDDITQVESGYRCGRHFSGWCFMITRKAWYRINGFDEDFPFWCADNAILEQLKRDNFVPVVTPFAKVKHLTSQTLRTVSPDEYDEMTRQQVKKFNRKYNQNLFNLGV